MKLRAKVTAATAEVQCGREKHVTSQVVPTSEPDASFLPLEDAVGRRGVGALRPRDAGRVVGLGQLLCAVLAEEAARVVRVRPQASTSTSTSTTLTKTVSGPVSQNLHLHGEGQCCDRHDGS